MSSTGRFQLWGLHRGALAAEESITSSSVHFAPRDAKLGLGKFYNWEERFKIHSRHSAKGSTLRVLAE